jgi:hypothetical protein
MYVVAELDKDNIEVDAVYGPFASLEQARSAMQDLHANYIKEWEADTRRKYPAHDTGVGPTNAYAGDYVEWSIKEIKAT